MTLQALLDSMEYSLVQGSVQTEICHLTEDSHTVMQGSVFFCRRGYHTDGIKYLEEALTRGAAAIISQSIGEEMLGFLLNRKVCVAVVRDVEEAMQKAASNFYDHPQRKLTLIGITGTKGKTTVSMMVHSLLEAAGQRAVLIGTNGVWLAGEVFAATHTTPPVLQLYHYLYMAVRRHCRYAVLEVSSLAVKQGRIGGLDFSLGIFTNFYPDHIGEGEHDSLEEYRCWKIRFLKSCRSCILNTDDPVGNTLAKELECPVLTCSREKMADVYADHISYRIDHEFWGSEYELHGRLSGMVRLSMPGSYNISNSLAAAAAAEWLNIPFETLSSVLAHVQVAGRCQVAGCYRGAYLIVDYAHNESSLEAVLTMVKEYHPGRIICMFGCGGERSRLRRIGMGKISARMSDVTVLTQDNSRREPFSAILNDILEGMKQERGECAIIPDRYEAIRYCIRMARPGDFILLLGKGHENYQEIDGVRLPFSDLEAVRKILKNQ